MNFPTSRAEQTERPIAIALGFGALTALLPPALVWLVQQRFPPATSWLATSVAVLVVAGAIAYVVDWRRRLISIELGSRSLTLHYRNRTVEVPYTQVRGLLSVGQLRLSGKNMSPEWIWKKTAIISDQAQHFYVGEPEPSQRVYVELRHLCPSAWGLPLNATLQLPERSEVITRQQATSDLRQVRSFVKRAYIRLLWVSTVCAVGIAGHIAIVGTLWMLGVIGLNKVGILGSVLPPLLLGALAYGSLRKALFYRGIAVQIDRVQTVLAEHGIHELPFAADRGER